MAADRGVVKASKPHQSRTSHSQRSIPKTAQEHRCATGCLRLSHRVDQPHAIACQRAAIREHGNGLGDSGGVSLPQPKQHIGHRRRTASGGERFGKPCR